MGSYKSTVLESFEINLDEKEPAVFDATSLAFRLGFTGKALWFAVRERDTLYRTFTKKKASGGVRTLHNPNPFMRVVSKRVRDVMLKEHCDKLGDHVTAYREGKSTLDAARRHLEPCAVCAPSDGTHTCSHEVDGQGHVRHRGAAACGACAPVPAHACPRKGVKIHMDLKDFFGSTRRSWIRQYFRDTRGMNHTTAGLLASLLTVTLPKEPGFPRDRHGVPQGGKASGDITNLVANERLDKGLLRMLKSLPRKWVYSRYADDLYFSTPDNLTRDEVNAVMNRIRDVVKQSGYRVNESKTHIQRAHAQQRLLGVVLNKNLNIPKSEYRKMRALLHNCFHKGFDAVAVTEGKATGSQLRSWIEGKLAYYTHLAPLRASALRAQYAAAKLKYPEDTSMTFTFGSAT